MNYAELLVISSVNYLLLIPFIWYFSFSNGCHNEATDSGLRSAYFFKGVVSVSSCRIRCRVTHDRVTRHMYQIFAGLKMLEDQGVISVVYCPTPRRVFQNNMMSIEVDGYGSVLYDVKDGYYEGPDGLAGFDRILDDYDYCFKRSYSESRNLSLFVSSPYAFRNSSVEIPAWRRMAFKVPSGMSPGWLGIVV